MTEGYCSLVSWYFSFFILSQTCFLVDVLTASIVPQMALTRLTAARQQADIQVAE